MTFTSAIPSSTDISKFNKLTLAGKIKFLGEDMYCIINTSIKRKHEGSDLVIFDVNTYNTLLNRMELLIKVSAHQTIGWKIDD